jgi:hypothetical protein
VLQRALARTPARGGLVRKALGRARRGRPALAQTRAAS